MSDSIGWLLVNELTLDVVSAGLGAYLIPQRLMKPLVQDSDHCVLLEGEELRETAEDSGHTQNHYKRLALPFSPFSVFHFLNSPLFQTFCTIDIQAL